VPRWVWKKPTRKRNRPTRRNSSNNNSSHSKEKGDGGIIFYSLRPHIFRLNATISFATHVEKLGKDSKSVHRMLGPSGNPLAENIFAIFKILQDEDNISLRVTAA
jgi:hypothetical protein